MLEKLIDRIDPQEWRQGERWYADAHADCSELAHRYSIAAERAIAVVSILSPGLVWDRNIPDAERLIEAYRTRKPYPLVGVYGTRNRDKAVAVLTVPTFSVADHISERTSPKVWNFYHCILNAGDSANHVCIDRHAKAAALDIRTDRDIQSAVKSRAEYNRLADRYRRVARSLALTPARLQAAVWVHWRAQFETPIAA